MKEQQVEIEVVKWKKEAEYVQQALAENMVRKNEKNQEKLLSSQQVTTYMKQEADIRLELEKIEGHLDENQRKHDGMLSKLHNIPGLRTIDSIYIEQGKIQAELGIMQDRRRKELEVARGQERRDFKLVDAYGEQKKFTFDAYITLFLQSCDCVVESGTAYTERLIAGGYGTREELLAHFPLWPMSLVVQENDKKEVESKLSRGGSGLTSPVFIMTTTEARAAAEGTYSYTTIWPDFWPTVLEEQSFTAWKNLFMEQAKESQLVRESKESAWQELDVLSRNLADFMLAYPQDGYQQCQQDKLTLQDQWAGLKGRINKARTAEQEAGKALEDCQQTIGDLNGKASDLHTKLEKASDWQQKERTRLAETQILVQCQQQLIISVQQLQTWRKSQGLTVAKQEQLTEKINVRKDALHLLLGEELYQQLQKFAPSPVIFPEETLKIKRSRLQEELAHLNLSMVVLQGRINTYRQEWKKFDNRLAELNLQVPMELVFPADGDITLRNLQTEVNSLQPAVQKDGQRVAEARRLYDHSFTRREERGKFYQEKFSALVHCFTEVLTVVKKRLATRRLQVVAEVALVEKNYEQVQQEAVGWGNLCT